MGSQVRTLRMFSCFVAHTVTRAHPLGAACVVGAPAMPAQLKPAQAYSSPTPQLVLFNTTP